MHPSKNRKAKEKRRRGYKDALERIVKAAKREARDAAIRSANYKNLMEVAEEKLIMFEGYYRNVLQDRLFIMAAVCKKERRLELGLEYRHPGGYLPIPPDKPYGYLAQTVVLPTSPPGLRTEGFVLRLQRTIDLLPVPNRELSAAINHIDRSTRDIGRFLSNAILESIIKEIRKDLT